MLSSHVITIIVSLVWGFGLALLFRKTCQGENCLVVKVPPEIYLNNHIIYDKNNRCYKLERYATHCIY